MKNILLLIHDDSGQESRLQVALDVTRAVQGHLTFLDVAIMPVLISGLDGGIGEAMLLEDERQRESVNRQRIEQRLPHEAVSWSWKEECGTIATCIEDASALADLIVLNRKLDDYLTPDMRSAVASVVAKSGRPVLAVPSGGGSLQVCGSVTIAWDGSYPAATAMQAAVPLLRLAQEVSIYTADYGTVEIEPEEAASYLSRHGIHTNIRREQLTHVSPADALVGDLQRHPVDYLVMGAFGHSQTREALFGGVTRRMLSASPVPIFIAR